MKFDLYDTGGFYDELFEGQGQPRPAALTIIRMLESLPEGDLLRRQQAAERALLLMGITFNVYGEREGTERILPFDIIPRIIDSREWDRLEAGLKQRVYALNLFIDDIYHDRRILQDGVVPPELVFSGKAFRKECVGLSPPRGVWCHITGTDLIRDADGVFHVLEDNLRCPSGVSYVLQNRLVMKQTFPGIFAASRVRPVTDYPSRLLEMLQTLCLEPQGSVIVGVLTPGVYNSAYYEHSFLAQQMGVELVEGRDLVVRGGQVHMRTTRGFSRVDVIYRRLDDDFLDPLVFRPDSLIGVPGIMEAYRTGRVALANAPGTGIADDKAIYAYVPRIIKYYLGEEARIPNVPTYICQEKRDLDYVVEHLDSLVVKAANESGGYGMLIGPRSTASEREEFRRRILASPRNYIAQPVMSLSRAPVLAGDGAEGRHVDLRPYILYGEDITVIPGGLTRVALRKGSLVVNSSQGGGTKDTWVLSP